MAMRWKTCLILAIVLTGYAAATFAEDKGVWIGTQFNPQQGLEIVEGTYDVKRKLCTINYEIRAQGDQFKINGRLRFNEMFIPDKVSNVELEILLMDENRVCTKQLNQRKTVDRKEVDFSFMTDKLPSQRYVRTYFIIHYR